MIKVLLVLAAVCVVVNGSAFEKGDKGALACDKIKIGHTQPGGTSKQKAAPNKAAAVHF